MFLNRPPYRVSFVFLLNALLNQYPVFQYPYPREVHHEYKSVHSYLYVQAQVVSMDLPVKTALEYDYDFAVIQNTTLPGLLHRHHKILLE